LSLFRMKKKKKKKKKKKLPVLYREKIGEPGP
jgi:hypothetical protein